MLTPVLRTTLSEQVALQIVEMISTGCWKAGDRLPAESDLCRTLHVGRSTLREALKSLAFVGIVRMRAGEGTFVGKGPARILDRVLTRGLLRTEKDVGEFSEARLVLETEMAALCAQRATAEDLKRLAGIVAEMRGKTGDDDPGFAHLDVEFHLTIAACSQNQVLAQLLRNIREFLQEWIVKSLAVPGSRELAYRHHARILEALERRDPQKARQSMRRHLETFQREYMILLKASGSRSTASEQDLALAELR